MIGDQDTQATLHQPVDVLLNILDRDRIDTGKRLIEQHELGFVDEGPGNLNAAPFAARQRISFVLSKMGDIQFPKQIFESRLSFLSREVPELQNGHNILFHRQFAKNGGFLRQVADPPARSPEHRPSADILFTEIDTPGIGPDKPNDHVKGRGFAGSVWTEQADHFARIDLQRDIADHGSPPVIFHQIFGFQYRHTFNIFRFVMRTKNNFGTLSASRPEPERSAGKCDSHTAEDTPRGDRISTHLRINMHRLLQICLYLGLLTIACSKAPEDKFKASLGKGYQLLENYQIAQADTAFGEMTSADPSSPIGLYGKGLVHERRFEYYDALEKYMALLQLRPDFSPANAATARIFRRLDEPELAAQYAAVYARQSENPAMAYISLAAIELDGRSFADAQAAIAHADDAKVGATWKDLVLARLYAQQFRFDSASQAFSRASAGLQKTPQWYELAADYYEARGLSDSAVLMSRMASEASGADQDDLYAYFHRCLRLRYDYEAGQIAGTIAERAKNDFAGPAAQMLYYRAIGDRFAADRATNKVTRRKELMYSPLIYDARVRWALADFQTAYMNMENIARISNDETVPEDFKDYIRGVVVLTENEIGEDDMVYKRIQSVGGFRNDRLAFRMAQAEMFKRNGVDSLFTLATQVLESSHGNQADWLTGLGKLYWGRVAHDSAMAGQYFARALEKDPSYQPAMEQLIDMYTFNSNFLHALELFQRYPQFESIPGMLARKAYCQVRAGQPDAGVATFLQAMAAFVGNVSSHRDFYTFLVNRGLAEQAVQVSQRALEANPKNPWAYALAAQAASDRQDYQKALELAQQGLALDGDNANLGAQKARALYLSGRKADGVKEFDALMKRLQMNLEVLHYYSRCLASDHSELPRAGDLARQGQFVEAGSYRASLNLSYVYYQTGLAAEARAEADRVASFCPYEPEPAYMLALALKLEGRPEAKAFFERAIALGLAGAMREKAEQAKASL